MRISLGTDKPELWQYTQRIVREVFQKEPYVYKVKGSERVNISLYQKEISRRLGVPCGNRGNVRITLPTWVLREDKMLISCLRGLYEAEGSFNIHKPTSTYKLIFSNHNESLLNEVEKGLVVLGFHPERRKYAVRLRKKQEVRAFEELIRFRKYGI